MVVRAPYATYHGAAMRSRTRTVTVGSGEWKGRVLRYPDDPALRPSMQRTKHSMFSSVGSILHGAVFADCFAGGGAVGIEALSRGASFVHFVEVGREAVAALEANLAICGAAPSRYDVHRVRVADMLARESNPMGACSIIYADPPYDADLEVEFLHVLDPARFPALRMVVVEHRTKQRVVPQLSLRISHERRFGDTTLTYLVRSTPASEG
jgi:16S rRNA (guanine966-N2)-methyltransferase